MSENPTSVRRIFEFIAPASIVFGIVLGTVYAQWFGNSGVGRVVSGLFCLMLGLLGSGLFYVALNKWFTNDPVWQKVLVSFVFLVSEAAPTSAVFLALQEIVQGEGAGSLRVASKERAWKETLEEMEVRLAAMRAETSPRLAEQRLRIDRLRTEISELTAEATAMDNDGDKLNDHMIQPTVARCESLKADLSNLILGEEAIIAAQADEVKAFATQVEEHRQRRESIYEEQSEAAEQRHPFVGLAERMSQIPGWGFTSEQTLLSIMLFWTFVIQWLPYGAVFGLKMHGASTMLAVPALPSLPAVPALPDMRTASRDVVITETAWMSVAEMRALISMLARQHKIERTQAERLRKGECIAILASNWSTVAPVVAEAKRARTNPPQNVTDIFSAA
jgi:uncharacterized small protein (DUF1192 family)